MRLTRRHLLRLGLQNGLSTTLVACVVGCGGHRLYAPKAMLSDVLLVELDDIRLRSGVLHVGGSVANLTSESLWLDTTRWSFEGGGQPAVPAEKGQLYEISSFGVAYVRVAFDTRMATGMVVIDGVSRTAEDSGKRAPLGAIPVRFEPFDERAAAPIPSGVSGAQPRGSDLLERDCGSGPLVTCPR